ncbi:MULTISPECIES: Z1 domain-containing protein [Myroides]|uniref:Z1 domain-containing protein n=1 Tax=Myroides TaxID=76831 RepID=UPI002574D648|nr:MULTISPECIES: Z1 domain-containing protein [Myroides]MDM1353265.1 Z1 domain-containing protein [Myroides marinus]MDM1461183.1 Z1 domain-containing protein [Myroides odoratimimus]
MVEKIFSVIIQPQLDQYDNPSIEDISEFIGELGSTVRIGKDKVEINHKDKEELLEYALTMYGHNNVDHLYERGSGIYNDGDETELNKKDWHFYKRHKQFLQEHVYPKNPSIIESIDYETDQIVKKFPKPDSIKNYNVKGLVIGYVQSGKTANFTHLISKAASIGYKFVIVLAGMTDTLRMQTQFRLDRELMGSNSMKVPDLKVINWLAGEQKFLSLTGLPDKDVKKDNGDFYVPVRNFSDHFKSTNDVTIAVIKKLARSIDGQDRFGSIIGNLINWIENRYDMDPTKMPPVLIIDDEADQASIDASEEDMDPTVINHAIRKLVSLFPQSVYVGYTATPFANVFVNPRNEFLGLDDLYPKDFIYSLPEPEAYFGSNRFFNTRDKNGELALINHVPSDEKKLINDEDEPITQDLKEALLSFIFSIIIRHHRGNDKYCGMLIHTDHKNDKHEVVYSKVLESMASFKIDTKTALFKKYEAFIVDSISNGRLLGLSEKNYPAYSIEEFYCEFLRIIDLLNAKNTDGKITNIKIINSREDKLNYQEEDLQYLICIGGNIMSRGVTIEGLTVTYYLRDTLKYDTLLQMGRWFGYRMGYEDLLRIYTTESIASNFEYVMGVEEDLRSEVQRYIEEGITPEEFAPKVRAHSRMLPSRKMGNATMTKSYSQQTVQTIYFDRDINTLVDNYNLGLSLINTVKTEFKSLDDKGHKYIKTDMSMDLLFSFLKEYNLCEESSFDKFDILDYVTRRGHEINSFDLIISSLKNQKQGSEAIRINDSLVINPVKRNKRKSRGDQFIEQNIVNLGVISDTSDVEVATKNNKLTLIFYFIDHINSDGFNISDQNFDKNELGINPLGFAIVFPRTNIAKGEYDYYQQIFM